LATFVLLVLVAHFSAWDHFFFTFFKVSKLLCLYSQFRFSVYIWGLGLALEFRFRVHLGCRF